MTPPLSSVAFLTACAFFAAVIDAIAGGGGTITLPALLLVGIPPHLALGTNKAQSVFGTLAALLRYRRSGWIDARRAAIGFPLAAAGASAGALLALRVPPAHLKPIVLGLLVAAGLFLAFRPMPSTVRPVPDSGSPLWVTATLAGVLGIYDGFFGPGTGTFLIVGLISLARDPFSRATANAKVINVASNLAALATFAYHRSWLWQVALPMAAAQIAGGTLGAHLAVRRGEGLIRWMVFAVACLLIVKLGVELYR